MSDGINISYGVANLLIDLHGDQAITFATRGVRDSIDAGDLVHRQMWLEIMHAIAILRRRSPIHRDVLN
ncbi:MAG TPA: hypothetical protein VH020_13090 [Stellaceae bacterium]|jgi:hypothetical protein|nr:hypothetical protein [Stellaceae bacterium]